MRSWGWASVQKPLLELWGEGPGQQAAVGVDVAQRWLNTEMGRRGCRDELGLLTRPTSCPGRGPGFHAQVCAPPLFLAVCSSLSLSVCVSPSLSLPPPFCWNLLLVSVRLWGRLALTSPPPHPQALPPHSSWPPPRPHPTLPGPPSFLEAKTGEHRKSASQLSSRRAPSFSPHPHFPPTHSLKIPS